jgi:hypothetical protein
VGARLISVGGGIEIDANEETQPDGWRFRRFTPDKKLEWSWTITPRIPLSRQELRLELMPALENNSPTNVVSPPIAGFTTQVGVEADFILSLSYWFETKGKLIAAVAATIAVAFLAILKFGADARDALKKLSTRKRLTTSNSKTPTKSATSSSVSKTPSSGPHLKFFYGWLS